MKVQDQHKIKPNTQSCQTSVTSSCGSIRMSFENNENLFERLENESVSIILTDPPYKYLKNQKLEVDFNEETFFKNCKRVLKNDGFIILFGRGISFYRWNNILDDLGFSFKEEIIWDKRQTNSPVMPIFRKHETISIFSKNNNSINFITVPYMEEKNIDLYSLSNDVKRIKSALNNEKSFNEIIEFLETGNKKYTKSADTGSMVTRSKNSNVNVDRAVVTVNSIKNGMKPSSIHSVLREHYEMIHPTQKPVKLLERLLLLVKKSDNDTVLDPFGGSFSTMEAVYNLGLNGITCELDLEYFEAGKNRILDFTSQQRMFL